jgi:haloacetate dehalogenase
MSSAAQKAAADADPLLPSGVARSDVWAAGVRFSVLRVAPKRAVGRPVLLLHGVPQTALVWRDLLPELGRDRIVIAPDLKGLGQSEISGPYDIPTLVSELAALVEAECGGEVDVVGNDWGGALAIALTGARPDLVRRLVVVNAPYREVDLRRAWHMPLFALPVVPELLFAVAGRQFWDRLAFGAAWKGPERLSEALRAHYLDSYADPERVRAMLAYYRGTVRPRVKALPGRALHRRLGRPVAPARAKPADALVVWGTADPSFPRAIGERVARDLGAELVPVEGAGHFPVEENPDVVVPAIAAFLRAGDVAAAAGSGR